MTADMDRRRPVVGTGAEVTADVAAIVARALAEGHEGDHLLCAACYGLGVRYGEGVGFELGYAEGELDGYDRGSLQRRFDLAAADPGYRVDRDLAPLDSRSELVRRRQEYRGIDGRPARPQTAAQIAARARSSWGRFERSVAEGQCAG